MPRNLAELPALASQKWAVAHVHFARAVGAARGGDVGLARAEVAKLADLEQTLTIKPGEYDWRKQISIERQIADAWVAHDGGKDDEAVRLMSAAADLDDATEKNPVTPGSILPAREQLGELLQVLGRPAAALKEYETSLQRAPRRLTGLYGAAQSARLAGDQVKAGRYFAELVKMTEHGDSTRAELNTARTFEAGLAQSPH